uniref:Ig-like domain-containing protein n=1 Tax=Serinus canaria TaxID=9135 RepID=A0A8C9N185_SERCA
PASLEVTISTLFCVAGAFPGAASDSVALKEGENLNLNCTFSSPSSNNFTLQWLNPRNFTIFLNAQQGKYQLLRYAQGELSIQLSNLSQQDEGTYRCLHYTRHVQTKRQKVEILGKFLSPGVGFVSRGAGQRQLLKSTPEFVLILLLAQSPPVAGDTRHQLGADGKSWSTRSTLRILNYSPGVTASCIIQHPALGPRSLVATFPFQDLPSASPENPEICNPSASPKDPEDSGPSATPGNPELSSPSASPKDPGISSPSASPKDPELSSPSASPENPEVSSPSACPGNPAAPSSAPALTDVTLHGEFGLSPLSLSRLK